MIRHAVRIVNAAMLIALTAGCGVGSVSSIESELFDEDPPVVTRKIAAFKQECASVFSFGMCLQSRADDSQEWRPTVMPGLDFTWGHEYTVQYRDTPIEGPLQDGPAFTRELLMVTDLGPVPTATEFDIAMRARDPRGSADDTYISNNGAADSYQAYFDTDFVCATPEVCLQVEDIIEQDLKFLGRFGLRPEYGMPLILKQVICVEENDYRRLLCDRTLDLVVTTEILDQFMQSANTFTTTEQFFARFTLNNTGSAIEFGASLCDQILIGFELPNGQEVPRQQPAECEILGDSDVSLGANSETVLLVDLNAQIIDTLGGNLPVDYLISLKFYNQPTHVEPVSIR